MQNSENTSKGDVLSKRAGQPAGCLQKGTNSIDKESPVWIKFADIHLCAAAGPEKQSFGSLVPARFMMAPGIGMNRAIASNTNSKLLCIGMKLCP